MRGPKPLVVLGSGPVGLLAAVRGRQLGMDVEVYTNGLDLSREPPRVECAPAQVVALLVEFGVGPRRIGVDALFQERTIQWSGRAVVAVSAPDVAHVGRPALDIALLETALRTGAKVSALERGLLEKLRGRYRSGECLLMDASGRSAVTAIERIGPKRPLVARLFHLPMRPRVQETGLMIAAGPQGYAYRLANATTLTIGVVGRKDFVQGDSREIVKKIAEFAPWIVRDISSARMRSGASGAASAQWTWGDDRDRVLVGDASFARDALASQGLAMGFSDALNGLVEPNPSLRPSEQWRKNGAISLHCQRIVQQIKSSPFSGAQPWMEYTEFLSDRSEVTTKSDVIPARL